MEGPLVPPGDTDAWTLALADALEHRAEMRAQAARSGADVRHRFELSTILDQLAAHLA